MGIDLKEKKGFVKSYLSGFFRAALVASLVFVQFGIIIGLSIWLRGYTVYIYAIIEIFSILIILGLVNDSRNPSYKIAWITIILILPLTGHIMYELWGKPDSKKKLEKKILQKIRHGSTFYDYDGKTMKEFTAKYPTKSRMARYLESYHFPLYKNNSVTYYPMGEETFEAIIQDIEQAKKFVMVNFFIVGEGVLWERVHNLLKKKVLEGVEVLFMYDDFGAMLRTEKGFKRNLEQEGIQVRVFNPIHKYTDKLYMNYRSHQKIIIVDGNIGYTGGMNLADEYVNLVERFGIWKDNAVRVEGDAVWGLTVTFLQMWEVCTDGVLIDYNPYRPTKKFEENQVFCQVLSDGPASNPQHPIEGFYKHMIHYAKKYLYVTTPYLVIEQDMQDALTSAVRSGIDVRIITPKIPDKKSVKLVTEFNYGKLLKEGVRIFEYEPGFIHAKTILNEDCAVVGTINMDYRSFYLHYECGLFICNADAVKIIKYDMDHTLAVCHEITYEEWKHRPWYKKVIQPVLNLFATLM